MLDTAQDILGLNKDDLGHSWDALRHYGNMSSATALFVLDNAIKSGGKGLHLLAAFGPGFLLTSWPSTCVRLRDSAVPPVLAKLHRQARSWVAAATLRTSDGMSLAAAMLTPQISGLSGNARGEAVSQAHYRFSRTGVGRLRDGAATAWAGLHGLRGVADWPRPGVTPNTGGDRAEVVTQSSDLQCGKKQNCTTPKARSSHGEGTAETSRGPLVCLLYSTYFQGDGHWVFIVRQ